MANDFAALWAHDHGTLPESFRQRLEAEGGEEGFACLDHFDGVIALFVEAFGQVVAWSRHVRLHDVIDG